MVQTNADWNSPLSQSAFSFSFAVTVLSPGAPTRVLLCNKMNAGTSLAWREHLFHFPLSF